ncbi:MAG: hypothetical protein IBJ03_05760 [Gemmatimonadaceae bacterium]|nr:hypothetical protein [Gemmatimonadaceae bacterium]
MIRPILSRRLALVALCVAAVGSMGCYKNGVVSSSGTVVLMVNNRGYFDVNVFAVRSTGSSTRRLGLVNGNSQRTIMVPENELQPGGLFVVGVRAVAGRNMWTSQPVQMGPGVVARLEVMTTGGGDLNQTQFFTQYAPPPEPIDTIGNR